MRRRWSWMQGEDNVRDEKMELDIFFFFLQEGETFVVKVVSLGAAILFLRKYKEMRRGLIRP
jgi:hypothetical protein